MITYKFGSRISLIYADLKNRNFLLKRFTLERWISRVSHIWILWAMVQDLYLAIFLVFWFCDNEHYPTRVSTIPLADHPFAY